MAATQPSSSSTAAHHHPFHDPSARFSPLSNYHHDHGVPQQRRMSLPLRDSDLSSGPPVAHTLTACTRCRTRKTRCDVGLPKCTPCDRSNAVCEYFDANRGTNVSRSYVVYLQHRVHDLEQELQRVENDDGAEDAEGMMRAAAVRVHEAKESKFLGPSSGIAITRLVMQLAKRFTDAASIKDIVTEQRARDIKELYNQEQAKPTSKIYPLISDVPATDLPNRDLVNVLVQLYKLRVQPMYPALHEPTLDRDIQAVFELGAQATPYQQFVCRMVIAISLQKGETRFAGLADSYYLAALQHLEPVVKPMDLRTLQCFALMAEYSLLTPTRTAIYYVVGIAVRLAQALGYHEEKSITRPNADGTLDVLEIDMRRRLFWCVMVMEFGLAHSLGRPAILATRQEHLNVQWFETCEDHFITPSGIDPRAQPTVKKWVAIHFFKMRLLQLEIRRKLYLRKRPTPRSDKDRWFVQMHAKITAWKDAAPSADESFGLDNIWFIGRYNTMVVFLFRPSPQVPRPSLEAALLCYDACEYNIYMQRDQINKNVVDMTWAFTQSLFMAINTMLWALSYDEVRRRHKREAVEQHLNVAVDAIDLASERWPGVASASQLYQNLISAIMKIYEKDGDVPIIAASPSSESASPGYFSDPPNRSRTTSPATASTSSVATPPEPGVGVFNYIHHPRRDVDPSGQIPYQNEMNTSLPTPPAHPGMSYPAPPNAGGIPPPQIFLHNQHQQPSPSYQHQQPYQPQPTPQPQPHPQYFDPYAQYNSLPDFNADNPLAGWTTTHQRHSNATFATPPSQQHSPYEYPALDPNTATAATYASHPAFDPTNPAYPFPATADPAAVAAHDPTGQHPTTSSHPLPNGSGGGGFADQPLGEAAFMQRPGWDTDDASLSFVGAGLDYRQQAELMRSLESTGMQDIQSLISSTLAAIAPKANPQAAF